MRALVTLVLVLFATIANAFEAPQLVGRVNDHAAIFSEAQRSALADKLKAIEETEGHPQVVILTVKTLGGLTVEDYAVQTFKTWKLGQVNVNNGVLVMVAVTERKIRFEVGYGLEGLLTDSKSKSIQLLDMVPNLARGKEDWYKAFDLAVDAISGTIVKKAAATEAVPVPDTVAPVDNTAAIIIGIAICLIVLIFIIVVVSSVARSNRRAEEERLARSKAFKDRMAALAKTDRPKTYAEAQKEPYPGDNLAAALATGVAVAAVASHPSPQKRRPTEEPRRRARSNDDDSSSSRSSSSSSDYGSSSSSSSDSGSFSGGGGDTGGGGSSSSF